MAGVEQDVTAADFVRNFAKYRETALTKPVVMTNNGCRTHVILALEEFETASEVRFANAELGLVTPMWA